MTVFVINIGNTGYSTQSLEYIKKLCNYNNVNLYVLDKNIQQNTYNLHPSWLKLFCHDLVDDDFIVCWDLDLVPCYLYDLKPFFDYNNINFSYDRSYLTENFKFNGKFKYNCGLIGIPKSFGELMKNIYYEKGKNPNYPSYEQYYVNDMIYDKHINPNVLNNNLNYMFDGSEVFPNEVLNVHYTWKIRSNDHRINLIDKHYKLYYENFKNQK